MVSKPAMVARFPTAEEKIERTPSHRSETSRESISCHAVSPMHTAMQLRAEFRLISLSSILVLQRSILSSNTGSYSSSSSSASSSLLASFFDTTLDTGLRGGGASRPLTIFQKPRDSRTSWSLGMKADPLSWVKPWPWYSRSRSG